MAGCTAHQCIQTRQQLFGVEGFGQIIVRTGFQTFDLVLPITTRRQNQYGHGVSLFPPLPNQVQTGHLRQADINHRDIVFILLTEIKRFTTTAGLLNSVTPLLQQVAQLPSQVGIIFNYQGLHQSAASAISSGNNILPLAASTSTSRIRPCSSRRMV